MSSVPPLRLLSLPPLLFLLFLLSLPSLLSSRSLLCFPSQFLPSSHRHPTIRTPLLTLLSTFSRGCSSSSFLLTSILSQVLQPTQRRTPRPYMIRDCSDQFCEICSPPATGTSLHRRTGCLNKRSPAISRTTCTGLTSNCLLALLNHRHLPFCETL